MTRRRTRRMLVALILVLATCSACASEPHSRTPVTVSQAEYLLPYESTKDWTTFGDHLVTAEVTDIKEGRLTPEEEAAGEGYVERGLVLRVESVLWSREFAPRAPAELTISLDGWEQKGDQRTPLRTDGTTEIAEGDLLVLPIVQIGPAEGPATPTWVELAAPTIAHARGGVASDEKRYGNEPLPEHLSKSRNQSPKALAALLKATPPYARAVPFMRKSPKARLTAVRSGTVSAEPGPGES